MSLIKKFLSNLRFKISPAAFCVVYSTLLYVIYNALNFDKIAKWFYLKDQVDYLGLSAFLIIGLCASIAVFALLFHRKTTKPLAIIFVILGAISAYFTAKYNVVIDRSMIMNVVNTDVSEVHSLLSWQMIPYIIFLMVLPISVILFTQITFASKPQYFWSSLKIFLMFLLLGIALLYVKFDSVHRASNLSKKYILHTLIPLNYFQSFGSIVQHAASPYFSNHKKNIEISGQVTSQENLIVVLAVGETSRQQNFSLYGYKRKNTNPVLEKEKNLHLLNGVARVGSTLYALPEILVKQGIPLTAITSKLGIETFCYVNYTLYDNCAAVGETKVANCGHDGVCYDEDVVPLLNQNLKSYTSGYRLVVLHLGGGSHGPSYHERYPAEFQRFQPMCHDADVVNQCSVEQLYNSYDNTILYVDYVLGKIINTLDRSKKPYVFIYLSDHGESLMEEGRIFHGMPPGIKLPPEQAHIPLIVKSSIPIAVAKRQEYGQQDVYDSILGLFSIETKVHQQDKSFIKKKNEKN